MLMHDTIRSEDLARAAHHDLPDQALPAIRELRTKLPEWEARAVATARDRGWTWAQIARMLGVTRQALHARYVASRH
jgi:DNA-directed RNA polymerase specialized sigma24 family protein